MKNEIKNELWNLKRINNSISLYYKTLKEIQQGKYENKRNIYGKIITEPGDVIYGLNYTILTQEKKDTIKIIKELRKQEQLT